MPQNGNYSYFSSPKICVGRHFWSDSHEIVVIILILLEIALVFATFIAIEIGEFGNQIRENVSNFFVGLIF